MGQRYAYNLGQTIGLDGLASLLPLLALMAAAGVWLWWTLRPDASSGTAR